MVASSAPTAASSITLVAPLVAGAGAIASGLGEPLSGLMAGEEASGLMAGEEASGLMAGMGLAAGDGPMPGLIDGEVALAIASTSDLGMSTPSITCTMALPAMTPALTTLAGVPKGGPAVGTRVTFLPASSTVNVSLGSRVVTTAPFLIALEGILAAGQDPAKVWSGEAPPTEHPTGRVCNQTMGAAPHPR